MPLASSGRAFLGRQAPRIPPPGGGGGVANSSRSIHIPSFARPNVVSNSSTAQTIFRHTRTILSRFVAHLTTPGTIRAPANFPAAARAFSQSAHARTIQQGFSLPVRYALSRPLHSPYLPRAPTVPRGTTQVGLGLARNFSTARPVFQNLVENVPVSGRALWEADWDIQMQKEREKLRMQKHAKKEAKHARKEMLQPLAVENITPAQTEAKTQEAELDHYFPAPQSPEVTTHLLIPLAPTPTARVPLSPSPMSSTAHPLLPLSLLGDVHATHGTHALRVQSLFARLDAAQVFSAPGVKCNACGDPRGLCTLLEVRFEGWDAHRVRSIIGEAGRDWCVLEEVWHDHEAEERLALDDALDAMSVDSAAEAAGAWHQGIDPAHSFVLPTIDFSAASALGTPAESWYPLPMTPLSLSPTGLSDLAFHNAYSAWTSVDRSSETDTFSDVSISDSASWTAGSLSAGSGSPLIVPSVFSDSWSGFGFSSEFAGRMREVQEEGPRESLS
ncbi:hypothetical protein B0H21DRAFT_780840 [Amylocystis lapponica]|nr:hypothetical protein B0H21DRAFT_780840 [Amylocystis lapponica]